MLVDIFMEQQRRGRAADKLEAATGGPRRQEEEGQDAAAFQLRRARTLEGGPEEATNIEGEIVRWFLQREWRLAWSGTPWMAIWASIWPRLEERQRATVLRSLGATEVMPCSMRTLLSWGVHKCRRVLEERIKAEDAQGLLRKVPNRAALRYAGIYTPLTCLGGEAIGEDGEREDFREALRQAGFEARTASAPMRALPWDAAVPRTWRTGQLDV